MSPDLVVGIVGTIITIAGFVYGLFQRSSKQAMANEAYSILIMARTWKNLEPEQLNAIGDRLERFGNEIGKRNKKAGKADPIQN
jgi:hypothetical protein